MQRWIITVKFAEVGLGLEIDDSPPKQQWEEIHVTGINPIGCQLVRCQFSADSVGWASDPVVTDERQACVVVSGEGICLFTAGDRQLFHKNWSSGYMYRSGGSADADPVRLGSVDERTHLRIIESGDLD